MNRRDFSLALASLLAAANAGPAAARLPAPPAANRAVRRKSLVKPPLLKPGALVGLIAPGGVVSDDIIQKCVRNLESLGFKVRTGANIRAAHGGYAGTVAQRLDDLHAMFADREVGAIWTARGGSGCSGLLPGIRYDFVRRNAKILIGYSDITALHLALYRRAGLVTFHGPVAWSTPTDYSVNQMQAVLMRAAPHTEINMSIENARRAASQPHFTLRNLRHGVAEGPLVGGNLSVLCALLGTPYAAELGGHLVFLEEVGEAPYRIDRMLTQLQQQTPGLGASVAVMLGVFNRSKPADTDPSLTLEQVIEAHLAGLPVPAVYGYSFGHIPNQFTLPVGVRARLDTRAETLTLLESAVST